MPDCLTTHSDTIVPYLFWEATTHIIQLNIIDSFINDLEKYIQHYCARSDNGHAFVIRNNNGLNLYPLEITEQQLIEFCTRINSIHPNFETANTNLEITLSNYIKALHNFHILELVNYSHKSNAAFLINQYQRNKLHLEILASEDISMLGHNTHTPIEIRQLIYNPKDIYFNILDLHIDKENYTDQDDCFSEINPNFELR
ncbi:MAG: hypothetical protein H6909_00705 [Rickettsiaceae bacterium]|nr:hypothetical protein [Rickettsiaceae bacterium]